MASDYSIRLVGRPKLEEDSKLGFQKLTRAYIVEGPKASKLGMDGTLDGIPLFRTVGEPDEEFADYCLIDQQLSPG